MSSARQGPIGAALLALALSCRASPAVETPCDALADRDMAIAPEEYLPCAAALMESLDALERDLRSVVNRRDTTATTRAEASLAHLRLLMQRVGFQSDVRREGIGPGQLIERWPDAAMREFNGQVTAAVAHYMAALRFSPAGNLEEGSRRHRLARQAYARFR